MLANRTERVRLGTRVQEFSRPGRPEHEDPGRLVDLVVVVETLGTPGR